MTRINVGINPKLLTDEHLLAEHREIKRVCSRVLKRNGDTTGAPDTFTLGSGHELFFLKYGKFTYHRYIQLREECTLRGFNVSNYVDNWKCYNLFPDLYNDYNPTLDDIKIIVDRITYRISKSPKEYFHYYGDKINKNKAIELILANGQNDIRENIIK